ncbi:hypothetical protein LH935_28265 (plasmid) [Gordonia polyisoprenivorans]|uniref:hypothetical protein n=1 Tax=Gordonia polyisoprenivorans TaxID=84595 RepID=UPI00223475BC|nr:hypothetical protein LH935_28265 [Gordonia polyisoprenivorans]
MASSHTTTRTARHRRRHPDRYMTRAGVAVVVTSSVAIGLGLGQAPALAAPEQGGVSPSAPQQGGVSPSPAPAPQQGGVTPAPAPSPGPISPGSPGLAPAPPAGPSTSGTSTTPTVSPSGNNWGTGGSDDSGGSGSGSGTTVSPAMYNPVPPGGWHAPRPTPDQPRPQWKPNTITLGNYEWKIKDLPPELRKIVLDNPRAVVSFNDWQAYGASQIARFLISVGVPKDEATRQAAAAIIGGVIGGGAGGLIAFTATAIVVGAVVIPIATLVGAGIGAGVGAALPPQPVNVLPGLGIGAGAGLATGVGITLAAALAAGLAGAIAAGTVGAAISWALGTGDPGKNLHAPDAPWAPGTPGVPAAPLPNPGGNQFEVHLPAPTAAAVGLPGTNVDYVVNARGDVNVSGQIAGQHVSVGWTGEQAQAPIKALGAAGPAVAQAINAGTRTISEQVQRTVPGVNVQWPQLHAPAAAPRR